MPPAAFWFDRRGLPPVYSGVLNPDVFDLADIWSLVAAAALGVILLTLRLQERYAVTMPMVCMALGVALYLAGGVPLDVMEDGLQLVAEITLAIVLFADASILKLSRLKDEVAWPARMLTVGLPLAIVGGAAVLALLYPQLPFWQVALIAALLAPTDAALGQAVFTNPAVPERLRDALTAESGLNDGLALPAIIFIACAAVGFNHDLVQQNWLLYAAKQIFLGVGLGAVLGIAGGWAARTSSARGWMDADLAGVYGLILIAAIFLSTDAAGGNGFVAVFVGGLCYGRFARECAHTTSAFLEKEGMFLMMVAFLYIGAILLPKGLGLADWRTFAAVVLSLFVIRPAAIWISLIGSGATLREKLFLGWFGPRGLATALFALLILHEFMGQLASDRILPVVALAVAASTLLHGVSAHFAASLCGASGAKNAGDASASSTERETRGSS